MAIHMDIQLADDLPDSIEEPPPSSQLLIWAQAAWQGELNAEPNLSLRIVSAAESQQLNNDYRGKNKATNVLSFPMQMDEDFSALNEMVLQDAAIDDLQEAVPVPSDMLGDLAICAEVVTREAGEQNKSSEAHWAHMLVHGMLHLQGFDHIQKDEADEMETLEIQIMDQLGFSNPYQNIDVPPPKNQNTEIKS